MPISTQIKPFPFFSVTHANNFAHVGAKLAFYRPDGNIAWPVPTHTIQPVTNLSLVFLWGTLFLRQQFLLATTHPGHLPKLPQTPTMSGPSGQISTTPRKRRSTTGLRTSPRGTTSWGLLKGPRTWHNKHFPLKLYEGSTKVGNLLCRAQRVVGGLVTSTEVTR